jgi:hypothetical protein
MRNFGIFIGMLLGLTACFSDQGADTLNENTFVRVFADEFSNRPNAVIEINGSLYILATADRQSDAGDGSLVSQLKLLKTSANGSLIWTKIFPEEGTENYLAQGLAYDGVRLLVLADSAGSVTRPNLFAIDINTGEQLARGTGLLQGLPNNLSLNARALSITSSGSILVGADVINPSGNQPSMYVAELQNNASFSLNQMHGLAPAVSGVHRMARAIHQAGEEIRISSILAAQNSVFSWRLQDGFPYVSNESLGGTSTSLIPNKLVVNTLSSGRQTMNVMVIATVNENVRYTLNGIDEQGQLNNDRWELTLNGTNRGASLAATRDNAMIIANSIQTPQAIETTFRKVSVAGDEIWTEPRSINAIDFEVSFVGITADDGILLLGVSNILAPRSIVLYKFNKDGRLSLR